MTSIPGPVALQIRVRRGVKSSNWIYKLYRIQLFITPHAFISRGYRVKKKKFVQIYHSYQSTNLAFLTNVKKFY
jgi:hypothetical protein